MALSDPQGGQTDIWVGLWILSSSCRERSLKAERKGTQHSFLGFSLFFLFLEILRKRREKIKEKERESIVLRKECVLLQSETPSTYPRVKACKSHHKREDVGAMCSGAKRLSFLQRQSNEHQTLMRSLVGGLEESVGFACETLSLISDPQSSVRLKEESRVRKDGISSSPHSIPDLSSPNHSCTTTSPSRVLPHQAKWGLHLLDRNC